MALTHTTAARNAMADAIDDLVNVSAPGNIVFQDAGDVVLVEFTLQNPAHGAAATGVITLQGTPLEANAGAAGTAAKYRVRDGADAEVYQGTITATSGGGDIEIDNTSIANGQLVRLNSYTWTAPV